MRSYKMITYKLNDDKSYAQRIVDGIATGQWCNTSNNEIFRADILSDEAQLEDADGNLMTAEQAKEFVATLP